MKQYVTNLFAYYIVAHVVMNYIIIITIVCIRPTQITDFFFDVGNNEYISVSFLAD